MEPGQPDFISRTFLATWVVIILSALVFFTFNKNAALKRKMWTPYLVGVGILFVGFIWLEGPPPRVLSMDAPAVALIVIYHIWSTRFCDSCGRTNLTQNPFSRPKFCYKCGAKLP